MHRQGRRRVPGQVTEDFFNVNLSVKRHFLRRNGFGEKFKSDGEAVEKFNANTCREYAIKLSSV